MKIFNIFLMILILPAVLSCSSSEVQTASVPENAIRHKEAPYVILISIDGYRYDYNKIHKPPHLTQFAREGIEAEGLIPVFPSKTFPNHYSIITGLYSNHHGIVSNRFKDAELEKRYVLGDKKAMLDGSWYGGVPLWSLAGQQNMVSASYFWVGSEAEIAGFRPSYYKPFDQKVPYSDRVNEIVNWLKLPLERRPHFLTLYFSGVDSAGHDHGPRSKEVKKAIMEVDENLGDLFRKVSALKLPVHYVIVSDHGMQKIPRNKVIRIDKMLNLKDFEVMGSGPLLNLYLKKGKKQSSINQVLKASKKYSRKFRVYSQANLPKALNYSDNPKVGNLVVVAQSPYWLLPQGRKHGAPKGDHGFSPQENKNMHGIFLAKGPLWKTKQRIDAFENIHIYPFLAKTLGLNLTAEIDGEEDQLSPLFQ